MNIVDIEEGKWYTITNSYHDLREKGFVEGNQVFIKKATPSGWIIKLGCAEWALRGDFIDLKFEENNESIFGHS